MLFRSLIQDTGFMMQDEKRAGTDHPYGSRLESRSHGVDSAS
jgi:hypothetical protein